MKFKKIVTCFLAAAIAAGGVMSGTTANYSYLRSGIVSAAVSVPTSATVLKESAYVTWDAISGADGYNVYVKPEGGSYTQLDSMLIRQYNSYFRADALGLKAGKYVMKVVPTSGGKEDTSKAIESAAMTVEAHDRSGFGFVNGTSSGAYNEDGTLKSNAIVLYVTNENKDTITCDIDISGKGAETVTGVQNIITGYKKGKESRPIAIRFIGNIEDPANMPSGDLYVDAVKAGMTIEGVGNDTTFNGFGLVIKNSSNLEVRNIGFMNCNSSEGDDCGLQQKNDHIWVHNCDFFYGDAGSDADQVKGDGALDTKTSTYITHSYNHFWDCGKCNLQGMKSESTENYITYHHNWYDHSDSRHPRIRTCSVHSYNNYFDGNSKYGIGVTLGASAFSENNYFRNCKYPLLISMQGSDTEAGGIFSDENGGIIKSYGDYMTGQKAFTSYQEDNTEFDAYVASSKTEQVPSSVKAKQGGTAYNNFDTSSTMYSYTADAVNDVPSIVMAEAGRVDGGDFKWTFDNSVDDESYAVNTALKAALVAYDDSIKAIGSGFTQGGNTDPTQPDNPTTTAAPSTTAAPAKTTTAGGSEVVPGDVKILGAGGWNEMMYLVASGIKDADVTGVSYSGPVNGSLTGDDLKYLVRDTDSGVRVDVTGLKAGTYSLTLQTSKGDVTKSGIIVGAQDRSGYAHFNYTAGVGAYNDDGTLKSNAVVLYVTEDNKNTVSITSKDGTTVSGIGHILNSAGMDAGSGTTSKGGKPNNNNGIIQKIAKDGTPLVIRIIGNVSAPDGLTAYDSVDYGGSVGDNGFMARMQSGKDVTIEGIGTDACINGWGIHFIAQSANPDLGKSFEVRNIAFRNVPEDCLGMEGVQEGSTLTAVVERCWIHNCEFYAPKIANPAESDKDGGDGACDFKRGMYFTNSNCYYEGYHKTNLVGSSDSSLQYHLTYHHNYWKSCESRGPLARQADIHMYNNIFDGQTSYCMNPRANAFIFSEYNYFLNSKDIMEVTSGGVVKSYMDTIENCRGNQQGTIVTDKSQTVSSSCTYANFDTDASISYVPSGAYNLQTNTAELKGLFETDGGCMDEMSISSDNPPTTTVVTTAVTGTETTVKTTVNTTAVTPVSTGNTQVAGGHVHNFTLNGTESTYYTIVGNLSTSKGTVNYNGHTLTQCLKMETATNITFTAAADGKLTLVFVEPAATVKVDGTKYTSGGDGIITVDLKAGAHTIAKADAANLFYMSYVDGSGEVVTTPATTAATTPVSTVATTVVSTPASTPVSTVGTTVISTPASTVGTTVSSVETTVVSTPATTVVTTEPVTEDIPDGTMYGDVTGDMRINVADVVAVNMYLLNPEVNVLTMEQKANADCARDKKIDTSDSALILNYVSMLASITDLGKAPQ